MTAELACLFPKGLKHEEAKHQTQRHQPPFCFMSDKIKESKEGDEHVCKVILVKLVPKSTMKVVPHIFSNVKNCML